MSATAIEVPEITMTQAIRACGGVPRHRVRLLPYPATEGDVETIWRRERRLFELVDGILVEKEMGLRESLLATHISRLIANYAAPRKLGAVTGADGMMQIAPGMIRIPDVSFIDWDQFPNRQVQRTAAPQIHPNLAVEVISPGNTVGEIDQKLREYFDAGTALVWLVEPDEQTVLVLTEPDRRSGRLYSNAETLDGGTVLPGFTLLVRDIFAELAPH